MTERQATISFLVSTLMLLGLLAWQVRDVDGRTSLSRIAGSVTDPVTRTVLAVAGGLRDGWHGYFDLVGARRELAEATRRIDQLEAERTRVTELQRENARLRSLLGLARIEPFTEGVAARVVARISGGPLQRRIVVSRGTRDGIAPGWTATASGGVVGRVVTANRGTSEVILIVDPESGVAVRHQLDRYAGVLRGGNRGPARLDYVPRDHAVAVGDTLVTSGLDGLYPPGLLVGRVRELYDESPLTWRIDVEVAFDPERLEEVLLVPPPSVPGDEVAP